MSMQKMAPLQNTELMDCSPGGVTNYRVLSGIKQVMWYFSDPYFVSSILASYVRVCVFLMQ